MWRKVDLRWMPAADPWLVAFLVLLWPALFFFWPFGPLVVGVVLGAGWAVSRAVRRGRERA
jgi:hypothetical protein